jgi:uncharacterized repeat protein (TIGR02543 family)
MSKKKIAGIIVGCIVAIIVIIVIATPKPTPTPKYTLTAGASPLGAGSVSPSGGEYESGVQVTVTANPASGYTFDYWSGGASGTASTITITMDSDKSVTANFKAAIQIYTLSTSVSPSGAGSVSPSGGDYESGVQVTLTASPASGYTFDHWSGDASGTSATVVITMDSDKSITAYFEKVPVTFAPIIFTGSSDRTTPPFTVTTSEWIIDWSYVPDPEYPEYASFGFFVYPRGETEVYVESVLFPGSTSGSTYSYAGPGEYYIKLSCANIKSWKITIKPP